MTYREITLAAEEGGVDFDLQFEDQSPIAVKTLNRLAKQSGYNRKSENNSLAHDFFYQIVRSKVNETDSSSSGAYQAPFGVSKRDLKLLNNMKETVIKEGFALYKDGNRKDGKWSGGKLVKIYDTEEDAKAAQKEAKAKDIPDANMYIVKKEAGAKSEPKTNSAGNHNAGAKKATMYKIMANGKAYEGGKNMTNDEATKLLATLKKRSPKTNYTKVEVKTDKSKVMKEGREFNYTTESYVFENKKYTKVIPMTETHVYTKQALTEALNRKKKN